MTAAPYVVTRTDIGRVRTNNEDAFFADHELGLFVVCDGMGGHQAGEVASRTTCDIVHRELAAAAKLRERFLASASPTDAAELCRAVESAILSACKEVYRQASRTPELMGMGTTCTVVLLIGHHKGVLGHVGDSRLLVLRGGRVHQLSEDHTYVNELVKRGALSREQARNHPQGNVLSRALGVQPTVGVDTMLFDIDPGDTFLLCSDGLYNYYPNPDELAQGLSDPALETGVNLLIDRALERGGHDNCTAIALRFAGAAVLTPTAAEQRIALLKRIPFFAHLSYPELVKVVGLTELRQASAGQEIIREGEVGNELYVVLSGEVIVLKDQHTIATLRAGAHVGEMGLIDNAPRSATVRAKTDVNLLVMRREEFFTLIRAEPLIAAKLLWSFLQVLSSRLRDTNEQLRGAQSQLASGDALEVFIDED